MFGSASQDLRRGRLAAVVSLAILAALAGGSAPSRAEDATTLTLYSGQHEQSVNLLTADFQKRSGIAVKAVKAKGSKEARSEIAEIRMSAGMIYFPAGAPFLWALEQELIQFPHGEYADQVDALAHAARQVQKIGGPPGEENENNAEVGLLIAD